MACIGAVFQEEERLEKMATGGVSLVPPQDRFLGDYRIDLSIAAVDLVDEYEKRRSEDQNLPSVESLKAFYSQFTY